MPSAGESGNKTLPWHDSTHTSPKHRNVRYCPVSAQAFSMNIVLSHVRESTDEATEDLPWFDQNLTQHPLQCNCRKAIPRVTGRLSKQILLLLLLNDLLYQKQHPHQGTAMSLWQPNHSLIVLRSQRPQFCCFLDCILSLLVLIIEIERVPKTHFVRERIGKLSFLLFYRKNSHQSFTLCRRRPSSTSLPMLSIC